MRSLLCVVVLMTGTVVLADGSMKAVGDKIDKAAGVTKRAAKKAARDTAEVSKKMARDVSTATKKAASEIADATKRAARRKPEDAPKHATSDATPTK